MKFFQQRNFSMETATAGLWSGGLIDSAGNDVLFQITNGHSRPSYPHLAEVQSESLSSHWATKKF